MITASEMQQYIEYYDNGIGEVSKLNDVSKERLLALFQEALPIASESDHYRKSFYFSLPKGSFEKYRSLHLGIDETVVREWFDNEDNETWFDCTFVCHQFNANDVAFYGVYINGSYVCGLNDPNEVEWPDIDATDMLDVLIEIVRDVIDRLRKGTYNDWVLANLSYTLKTGTISRKDYYDAFPEEREKYRISDHAREILLRDVSTGIVPKTARQYYEACAVCYHALGLSSGNLRFEDTEEERTRYGGATPRELYYRFADGRDDGLAQVDLDSETEFLKWLQHKEPYGYAGGHPFEIIFSFSGQHSVHLYAWDDRLYLAGGQFPANMSALKMYVALVDQGYKVEFANRDSILQRVEETDRIGIKPWFEYESSSDFDEDVLDVIELDSDSYPKLKAKIVWQPIRKTYLTE